MDVKKKKSLPWWKKYTLTLNEASEYFGIGYKRLKGIVEEHPDEHLAIENGNRLLIKRERFGDYIDQFLDVI